jgi:very-short-patch-repair endonuclease
MLVNRARELRKNPTEAERKLWAHLRLRQIGGYKFRRQHPLGPYIVDVVCIEKKLIVEVDGGQHDEKRFYDAKRDKWLEEKGFKVIRFWNNEVLRHIDIVKEVIESELGCGER